MSSYSHFSSTYFEDMNVVFGIQNNQKMGFQNQNSNFRFDCSECFLREMKIYVHESVFISSNPSYKHILLSNFNSSTHSCGIMINNDQTYHCRHSTLKKKRFCEIPSLTGSRPTNFIQILHFILQAFPCLAVIRHSR